MVAGTTQKLRCADETCMDLFLNDAKLEEAMGEKLLRNRIDKNLTWNLHPTDCYDYRNAAPD